MKTESIGTALLSFVAILTCGLAMTRANAEIHANVSSGSLLIDTVATPPPVVYRVRDPYRLISNVVYTVREPSPEHGWVEFQGRIWNVQSGGVCINGSFTGYEGDFYVAHFPEAADNETVGRDAQTLTCYCAKYAGTYTYSTVAGGTKTLRMLEYGEVYRPPAPTQEEIEAAKKAAREKAEAMKNIANAKALAANEAAAEKGDAYGLLRMGERYRDGDGVEKDLIKAKDYLQKSADAGSPTAADELKKLPDSK